MRRHLALLPLLLATWVLVAATAGAASRDLGAFGDGPLLGDGRGYVAVPTGSGTVKVLDVRTGRRSTVRVPGGCAATDVRAGRLVVSCPDDTPNAEVYATGFTVDLRSGARVELPPVTRAAFGVAAAFGFRENFQAVGRRWAEIREEDYHYEGLRYLDLTTGAVSFGPGSDLGVVADLDAPSGVRSLCSPVRRPMAPDASLIGLAPGPLAEAGRYAAGVYHRETSGSTRSAQVRLGRCGAPAKVVRRCEVVTCAQVALDRRTLAWVETEGAAPSPSRIVIRSVRTGKSRRIGRSSLVQMELARGQLYVLMDGRLRRITP